MGHFSGVVSWDERRKRGEKATRQPRLLSVTQTQGPQAGKDQGDGEKERNITESSMRRMVDEEVKKNNKRERERESKEMASPSQRG